MVKLKIILIGSLLFCGSAFAQRQVYIGVTGGPNFSTVFFNHLAFPTNIRTTLQAGINLGLNFKHFAPVKKGFLNTGIEFSFNYVEKGYGQTFPGQVAIEDYTLDLNYLEIPFSGIVYFGKKKTKIFLSTGIFAEFLLNSSSNNLPIDDDTEDDFINVGASDVFPFENGGGNKIGAGGKIGAGILSDFGFGAIQLSSHFSYSLTNILKIGTRSSGIPDTSNNLVIGVSIGYFFKFKAKQEEENLFNGKI